MNYTLIITIYNEESALAALLLQLKPALASHDFELIVVNDGSNDESYNILKSFKDEMNSEMITIINHPYNKGYGAAIKSGIRSATTDNIVMMDADGQHSIEDMLRIAETINEFDMVIGDRGEKASSAMRNFGKWILKWIAEYLIDKKIPDLNSGLRAVRKDIFMEFMDIYPNGFSITTTMTLAFIKAGYNVTFVPIQIEKRSGGKSQVAAEDAIKTLLLILRIIMLFNPLKVFVPIGLSMLSLGLIYALWGIYYTFSIPKGALFASISGLNIFFFGLIADQISIMRRSSRSH
jgi:glycosyltransferase involved in cell wall biosynthesis